MSSIDQRGDTRPGDDELVSLPTVAKQWLHVSLQTVHRHIRSDRPLPIRRLGPSTFRVRVGDLREWIRQTPQVGV